MVENLQTDLTVTAQIQLYYDVYIPDSLSLPAPLLIAVHGYGAHKRYMMREARAVADDRFVVASVQAPHPHYRRTDGGYRVGFGWLSDHKPEEHVDLHHRFLLEVIGELEKRGIIRSDRLFLYGFSQACALNFKFALTYPDLLFGVIGVCGGIPGDLDTNEKYRPYSADTLYLHGDEDEFYTQQQFSHFDDKLTKIIPNLEIKKYRAGHEITDEMRSDIRDWLARSV